MVTDDTVKVLLAGRGRLQNEFLHAVAVRDIPQERRVIIDAESTRRLWRIVRVQETGTGPHRAVWSDSQPLTRIYQVADEGEGEARIGERAPRNLQSYQCERVAPVNIQPRAPWLVEAVGVSVTV